MTRNIYVVCAEVRHFAVSVRQVYFKPVGKDYGIVGRYVERQYHLVYLAVAVASDAQYVAAYFPEHFCNFGGVVSVGQRVPRSVVQYVAEQREQGDALVFIGV